MIDLGNVYILELASEKNVINAVLIKEDADLILIDAGYPGQIKAIQAEIENAGFSISQLTKLLLTHQDIDHVGCINDIKSLNPSVEIICSEREKPYIQWDKTPVKAAQNEALYDTFTDEKKQWFNGYKKSFIHCKTQIDSIIADSDEPDILSGLKIIHTPGHTPGHISVYIKRINTVVSGDALTAKDGILYGPEKMYTYDMPLALKSLEKLNNLDIDRIVCYHGGLVCENVKPSLLNIQSSQL